MAEKFRIEGDLDAGRFNGQAEAMRQRAESAATANGKLTAGFTSMQPMVEKAATASSGLASALGGVGSSAGASLGAVSNFAAAFATGGPFLAAVAVASTGLGFLIEKWVDAGEAAKKSRSDQIDSVHALAEEIEQATGNVESRIARAIGVDELSVKVQRQRELVQGLKREYDELVDQGAFRYAKALGLDVTDATEAWSGQLRVLEEQIFDQDFALGLAEDALVEYEAKLRLAASLEGNREEGLKKLAASIRTNVQAQKELNSVLEMQRAERAFDTADFERTLEGDMALQAKQAQDLRAFREAEAQADADIFAAALERDLELQRAAVASKVDSMISELARLSEWRDRFGVSDFDGEIAALERNLAAYEENERAKTFLKQREEDERLRLTMQALEQEQAFRQQVLAESQAAFSTVISGVQMLVNGMVTSQERAAELALAAVLTGLGNQLVGIGTKAGWEGVIRLLETRGTDPTGYGLVAAGAGAIAAGIGMGAVGAGIQAGAFGSFSGGGGGFTGSPIPGVGPAGRFAEDRLLSNRGRENGSGPGLTSSTDRRRPGDLSRSSSEVKHITIVNNAPVYDLNQAARHFSQVNLRRAELLEEATA